MTDDRDARLARIETRLTEQEATIDDLNATITRQWRTIDALVRSIARLTEQVEEAAARGPSGAQEPPPPHY